MRAGGESGAGLAENQGGTAGSTRVKSRKNDVAESTESAPELGVAESAESTSARLRRRGGDAVVKDRRLPGRQDRRHYAPAGLSGWKIGSGIREVTEKAADRPLNPTIFSRIASTASRRDCLLPVRRLRMGRGTAKRWRGGSAPQSVSRFTPPPSSPAASDGPPPHSVGRRRDHHAALSCSALWSRAALMRASAMASAIWCVGRFSAAERSRISASVSIRRDSLPSTHCGS